MAICTLVTTDCRGKPKQNGLTTPESSLRYVHRSQQKPSIQNITPKMYLVLYVSLMPCYRLESFDHTKCAQTSVGTVVIVLDIAGV